MPQVLVTDTYLTAIGDAIRYKNGSQEDYLPSKMAPAIRAITGVPEGYLLPSGTFEISSNGEYDIGQYKNVRVNFTPTITPAGHVSEDANGIVTFSAEAGLNQQQKTVTPSLVQQVIIPDEGYDALSSITISAVTLQNKSATPNDTTQTLTADSGYLGLSTVTVNPVPNTYISRSEVITYYVDTVDPTSTDGEDGDIWLVTEANS